MVANQLVYLLHGRQQQATRRMVRHDQLLSESHVTVQVVGMQGCDTTGPSCLSACIMLGS